MSNNMGNGAGKVSFTVLTCEQCGQAVVSRATLRIAAFYRHRQPGFVTTNGWTLIRRMNDQYAGGYYCGPDCDWWEVQS